MAAKSINDLDQLLASRGLTAAKARKLCEIFHERQYRKQLLRDDKGNILLDENGNPKRVPYAVHPKNASRLYKTRALIVLVLLHDAIDAHLKSAEPRSEKKEKKPPKLSSSKEEPLQKISWAEGRKFLRVHHVPQPFVEVISFVTPRKDKGEPRLAHTLKVAENFAATLTMIADIINNCNDLLSGEAKDYLTEKEIEERLTKYELDLSILIPALTGHVLEHDLPKTLARDVRTADYFSRACLYHIRTTLLQEFAIAPDNHVNEISLSPRATLGMLSEIFEDLQVLRAGQTRGESNETIVPRLVTHKRNLLILVPALDEHLERGNLAPDLPLQLRHMRYFGEAGLRHIDTVLKDFGVSGIARVQEKTKPAATNCS